MRTLEETLQKLNDLKATGYIKTHRAGPTGIGKTLEDLLDIEENNIAIANTTFAEIKSARKGSQSMLTLFTKSPMPPEANGYLLNRYGYVTLKSAGRKILHSTVWATSYNTLRGETGFMAIVNPDKLAILSADSEQLCYWDEKTLRNSFEKKLHHVLYVLADCKGRGESEEFWFNEAWLLAGFDFAGFASAVKDGTICVDLRIGQYPNGRPHDHGTGFRILPSKLKICFKDRQRLI